jgi:GNAT superfamily N-acetyltransferase
VAVVVRMVAARRGVGCRAVSIEVRPLRSRGERSTFIKLPWRIYGNADPWVPPLVFERRRYLDARRNPWFAHGEAELFLALRDGEPVGRISAQVDRAFNDFHGERWGWFGFFECCDDPEAASALLDAAERWLRERGQDRMIGPASFTMNDEAGILIDGYDRAPILQTPWHHPYYRSLMEGAGLAKAMDLFMWEQWFKDLEVLPVIYELAEKLEPEHGITLRKMRKRDLEAEIKRFVEVYNAAWSRNWGFVPISEEELVHAAKENRPLLDEDWLWVAEKGEETVGAALTFPDFNQVLARLDGRLLPLGWAKALRYRRKIDRVRVGFLGVKPEYQHTGVAAGLYVAHFNEAARKPQSGGEMGWILESNTAMNRGMEAMGAKIVKRFRMYERSLRDAG